MTYLCPESISAAHPALFPREGTMKILLVEDTQKHFEDAIGVLTRAEVEFVHVKTLEEAEDVLRQKGKGGITHVLTDLFLPQSYRGDNTSANEPCGLSVALLAEELKLEFIICTDGHHHGPRYDWICQLGRRRKWPEMVDHYRARTNRDVAETKLWAVALAKLTGIVLPEVA